MNGREMRRLGVSRRQLFDTIERPVMQPLPEQDYEYADWHLARVGIDYHVEVQGFLYSVPHALIREPVNTRATMLARGTALCLITCRARTGAMPNGPLSGSSGRRATSVGFVWPPRPGDCSTARWAPPTSAREVAEHRAAYEAEMAQIDAKIQAKKLAEEAERHRRDTPSLMTDEELRGQMRASRRFMASINKINAELSAEMARRGLEAA